jgi:hypothetical protein
LYVAPEASGVTTGTAAPTNSASGPTLSSLATQTLPDPSIAIPYNVTLTNGTRVNEAAVDNTICYSSLNLSAASSVTFSPGYTYYCASPGT